MLWDHDPVCRGPVDKGLRQTLGAIVDAHRDAPAVHRHEIL
jgi:hypothetical protein